MKDQNLYSLMSKAADLIVKARKIVVFTGAGVSTESGIPDFRSPGGIWEKFDPSDFTYQKFVRDPKIRRKQWQMFMEGKLTDTIQPNPAHRAIAELDKMEKLDCVITQNVDNLHQKAGVPDSKVFELHGNMQWAVCLQCGRRYPLEQVVARMKDSEETPGCESCRGILKPDVVLFGEALPAAVLEEAASRSRNCDLFIVVGSSLVVTPAAFMPQYAISAGAKLVIINLSTTPLDTYAEVVITARAGEVMPEILGIVKSKT